MNYVKMLSLQGRLEIPHIIFIWDIVEGLVHILGIQQQKNKQKNY